MGTFYMVMAIILFVLAGVSAYGAIRSLNGQKSFNTKYNKLRETLSPEEQKKRDRLIAIGMFVIAAGAIVFGLKFIGVGVPNFLGEIMLAIGLIIDIIAVR